MPSHPGGPPGRGRRLQRPGGPGGTGSPPGPRTLAPPCRTTRGSWPPRRTRARTGSAHTPSDSSRGGNASKATSPTRGSPANASSAATYISVSTAAWPVTSSGLFCPAKAGRAARRRRRVAAASSGSSRPASAAASANNVHAPPDCRAAATPDARSVRWDESSTAASNISTGSAISVTPCARSHASRSAASPASAPVWATIERCAASLRPAGAHIRTGLSAARSASSPRPMPSTSRIVST